MLINHPWQNQSATDHTVYLSRFSGSDQPALKQALETCTAKAVSLLDVNIQEDSLYLLFEWNPVRAELAVVVTDANKINDGAHKVQAELPDLQDKAAEKTLPEIIKFLLSDFLASYSPFFNYSLVAIFHSSSRAETSLL